MTTNAPSSAVRAWQFVLITVGIVVLLIGGYQLLTDVAPSNYFGIAVWLVAALVIHDGIIAFTVLGVSVLARRIRMPFMAFLIVQAAIVAMAIVALLFIPEVIKKAIGTANPSILPLNYAINLAVFAVVLAVVTAIALVAAVVITRRRAGR